MMIDLRCCGEKNPIGVDKQNIRLSFALSGSLEIAQCTVKLFREDSGELVCSLPVITTISNQCAFRLWAM